MEGGRDVWDQADMVARCLQSVELPVSAQERRGTGHRQGGATVRGAGEGAHFLGL